MWKRQDETSNQPANSTNQANPIREASPWSTPTPQAPERKSEVQSEGTKSSVAHIGKSVQIKGELSASEDMYIDGQIEGNIELREHHLTVGSNGKVQANIKAKKVIILGAVKGNIRALESVDIRKSGSVAGDLVSAGVIIEEGAYFKGSIDIQKAGAEPKPEPKKAESTPQPEGVNRFAAVAAGNAGAIKKTN